MSYKAVSKYVTKFISEHGLDEKWNENDFKKLFREKKSKKLDGIKKNKSAYMFRLNQNIQRTSSRWLRSFQS